MRCAALTRVPAIHLRDVQRIVVHVNRFARHVRRVLLVPRVIGIPIELLYMEC